MTTSQSDKYAQAGREALVTAVMRVEEEDEELGVVGRGRMVDRIYDALVDSGYLIVTAERVAEYAWEQVHGVAGQSSWQWTDLDAGAMVKAIRAARDFLENE
jgi:hypothetical protein